MFRIVLACLLLFLFCSPSVFASEEVPETWTCSYAYKHTDNQFSHFTRMGGATGIGDGDTLIERFIKKDNILELVSDDEVPWIAKEFTIVLDNESGLIATHAIADPKNKDEVTAITLALDKRTTRYTISIIRTSNLIVSEERRGTCMKNG